jgi:hypothetical protein
MIKTFSFSSSGDNLKGKYPEKLRNSWLSKEVSSLSNLYIAVPAVPSTKKIISLGSFWFLTRSDLPKALQRDSITLACLVGGDNR